MRTTFSECINKLYSILLNNHNTCSKPNWRNFSLFVTDVPAWISPFTDSALLRSGAKTFSNWRQIWLPQDVSFSNILRTVYNTTRSTQPSNSTNTQIACIYNWIFIHTLPMYAFMDIVFCSVSIALDAFQTFFPSWS